MTENNYLCRLALAGINSKNFAGNHDIFSENESTSQTNINNISSNENSLSTSTTADFIICHRKQQIEESEAKENFIKKEGKKKPIYLERKMKRQNGEAYETRKGKKVINFIN